MSIPDEPGAEWIPSPHFNGGNHPRYVIVHGTASGFDYPPEATAHDFQGKQGGNPTSTHYVIGKDGKLVQCVEEKNVAWGNGVISHGADSWWTGDPNTYTISIEHAQNTENSGELPQAERDESFKLIAHICARWGIPMRTADAKGGITGHKSIDPVHRWFCPGNYPWAALWAYLATQGGTSDMSGAGGTVGTYLLGATPSPSRWPWLTENLITQTWNGSTETGVDLGMVINTPITALTDGTIVGSDVDTTGAYVGQEAVYNGNPVCWYYQHLNLAIVHPGDLVTAGQLLGYSGGQTSGGIHPAITGSTGPHIEVGINFPWGGGRNPHGFKPNYDPVPTLAFLASGGDPSAPTGAPARLLDLTQKATATTGFMPLAQALGDAEQYDPWYAGEDWRAWIGNKFGVTALRGIFVLVGLALILLVIANAVKGPLATVAKTAEVLG